jgi:mono/diheme cytochrome c family protein
LVARGAYLAKAADCAGCHTATPQGRPPQPSAPFAGGLPVRSPFGIIWSSNITPDPDAGIGRYRYEDFVRAVRDGIAPGGKHLYPAMPYPSFAKISDDDMHALYAYFMHGVQPVAKRPPQTELPFPFNQRWALVFWNEFFAPHERFKPNENRSAAWNRGAYLVQALGHCGACHTARGPAFEERGYNETDRLFLTGGTVDHWFAPNLTGDAASGLGRWSQADIASFLKHGHGAGAAAFGSMVEVVENSGQYLTDTDLQAISTYLKTLVPRRKSGFADTDPSKRERTVDVLRTGAINQPGAGLYRGFCARCHHDDGMGEPNKYPRLAGSAVVLAPRTTSLVRLLIEGGSSAKTEGGPKPQHMPAFGGKLTDTEMARVLTFVRNAWGNQAAPVTTRQVREVRTAIGKAPAGK